MLRIAFILLALSVASSAFAQEAAGPDPMPEEAESEDLSRVLPVFDPGSHTRPIVAMGFSADKSKLITVGEDYTIQVWSVATGERLDILRLPGYGREKGFDTKDWDAAAVSFDGTKAALGGGQKKLYPVEGAEKMDRTKMVVVDIPARTVRRIIPPKAVRGAIAGMAFSRDGDRLAVAHGGRVADVFILNDLNDGDARRRRFAMITLETHRDPSIVTFNPDGNRLAVGGPGQVVSVLNVRKGANPTVIKRIEVEGQTTSLDWSADGSRLARTWSAYLKNPRGVELFDADGEPVKRWQFGELPPFSPGAFAATVRFVGQNDLLLSTHDRDRELVSETNTVRFDTAVGRGERLFSEPSPTGYRAIGAVSRDGELAAVSVSMGLDAVVYRVKDGQVVSRCGAASPIPTMVGWSVEGKPPGFAWSETIYGGRLKSSAADLQFGFDLARVEPAEDVRPESYRTFEPTRGDWTVQPGDFDEDRTSGAFTIRQSGKNIGTVRGGNAITAITLVPDGEKDPLVAWAYKLQLKSSAVLVLSKADGERIRQFQHSAVHIQDLAVSPDGRFVIATTGTHRLHVYTTGGSQHPLLTFARVNGGWVAWTPEGYYAASPGGEKLFGWAVSNGPFELATFHAAERFASAFRRPDVIRLAVEKGSVEAALKELDAKPAEVEELLPPRSELKLLKQTGPTVVVKGEATSGVKDKPVIAMKLLLDGRPLPEGRGVVAVPAGKPAEATWELNVPGGSHELKLFARNEDGADVSEPLVITAPKTPDQMPVLFRVCVGVDEYDQAALRLNAAAKDATDVFAALEQDCVGLNNRFGTTKGRLICNKDATRAEVLKSLAETREAARPGDLVVLFFAGHGVKQEDEFFLLTREANLNQSLKEKSLSGGDLRKALSEMGCPVLLIMDACHSARGVKAFRPATDDLSRDLTDDAAGVTVLAAAMSHEVASATAENGYFTAALLKALQLGQGVPFDPNDRALYTHHIYSVVFSEVRRATNGKQNPFLNAPWTVPPLAVRDVPGN